uniref:C2H2-type domain-containing protein n=1 Tax=Steinernema glaseri TaxID=37863 RepID=A0A1I7YAT0_9BILA
MGDYFPEKTEEKSPFCKKCGKKASGLLQRRDHVATHLKVKIPCPFRHCSYSGQVDREAARPRKKFYEKVDAVMDNYFP